MPRFEPFAGLRYDPAHVDLDAVTAPPYDVIGDEERAELAARSPHNIVHVDLPVDGEARYAAARDRLDGWIDEGVLVADPEPSFYVYTMDHPVPGGRRTTRGVIGALELVPPGEGDVLPHEHTTPKAKSDRLALLEATGVNLSAIWVLSLAAGLGALCGVEGPPDGECTDADGVVHRIWRVSDPDRVSAISELVGSAPAVIADGHHRFETSLAHRQRRDAEDGPGPWDLAMTYAVELSPDELTVGPIHRVLTGLPAGFDLAGALSAHFDLEPTAPVDDTIAARMAGAGALALVLPGGTFLARPRSGAVTAPELDSERLDAALADLPPHELGYQHGAGIVAGMVAAGAVQGAVLLRPVTVAQIQATAHARDRMPPKSTYFWPKPRTGPVLRSVRPPG